MLEFREKGVHEVSGCTCDRSGRRMTPDEADWGWHERVSIADYVDFILFSAMAAQSVSTCASTVCGTLWVNGCGSHQQASTTSNHPRIQIPLSSLRGILRHDADDALSAEQVNAAIANDATVPMTRDLSLDTGQTDLSDIDRIVMKLDATRAAASLILNGLENLGSATPQDARAGLTRQVRQQINELEHSALQGLVDASPVRLLPHSHAGMGAKAIAAVLEETMWLTAPTVCRRQTLGATNLLAVTNLLMFIPRTSRVAPAAAVHMAVRATADLHACCTR
ncbi:hypothetical protein [Paraburkholderia sp. MM5482-R1]|uniref:hypothetical protein n=1 Tax=unclassified Paraburkholderia TaxID=2615204 RepID=UPI003D24EC2A